MPKNVVFVDVTFDIGVSGRVIGIHTIPDGASVPAYLTKDMDQQTVHFILTKSGKWSLVKRLGTRHGIRTRRYRSPALSKAEAARLGTSPL